MVPDDLLKNVSLPYKSSHFHPMLTPTDSQVHDQDDAEPERALAHSQADDAPDGLFHLRDVCPQHGRPSPVSHPHLAIEWQDVHLGHAPL